MFSSKNYSNITIDIIDPDSDWNEGAQLREDLSLDNFIKWNISGYTFYAPNKKKKMIPVACIYELWGKEYILLDQRIAVHPIPAKELIWMLRKRYQELHIKTTKQRK